jgi:DNA-binding FrmR family transcriptional regulator
MPEIHTHATHPEIVNRLKRAEGHLRSIVAMIENRRPCVDIAQQMHAVEKAVAQAKRRLVQDHIDNCLADAVNGGGHGRGSMEELKAIAQYL